MAETGLTLSSMPVPQLPGFHYKILLQEESRPYSADCQIEAENDLEAVRCWLKKHAHNVKTFDAYQREAQRLLMWCVYERGLPLGKLKVQDFEAYFKFLQMPPTTWCASRSELRSGKHSTAWRPFIAGLNNTALKMAGRVLHSLMNYLVTADYLRSNPLKLVNAFKDSGLNSEERRYQVWDRMLEKDEWQAVEQALENMPETRAAEITHKIRTQLLFGMLYFLGLRIHEVANQSWNAFRLRENQWWFFVKGKGQKYAHIPVNDKLLSFVKVYRLHLGKLPLPSPEEFESIFISSTTQKPLQIRQLYNWVKTVGLAALKQFEHEPLKQKNLQRLSPHWLRHLFASHLDRAGVSPTVIKSVMRHASLQTTQIYIHAEDALRHQEVQKIGMEVFPYKVPDKPTPQFLVKISLSAGSASRLLSLEKLIEAIEQNILSGYRWRWEGVAKSEFFAALQQEIVRPKHIHLSYVLEDLNDTGIHTLKSQITLESEIRLFVCQVEIGFLL